LAPEAIHSDGKGERKKKSILILHKGTVLPELRPEKEEGEKREDLS